MDSDNQAPKESDIAEKAGEQRPPVFDPTGRVEQLNSQETKIADVRRHPFGLIVIYLQAVIALALAFGLIIPFALSSLESLGISSSDGGSVIALFGLIAVILVVLYLMLATRIYKSNQLILTNNNVTQVTQAGLFNRKVSEISMGNVEDVTALQSGIFQTFFNFGHLHIETAGEQNNYDFRYCPNPNAYAKAIQDARVEFLKAHGN